MTPRKALPLVVAFSLVGVVAASDDELSAQVNELVEKMQHRLEAHQKEVHVLQGEVETAEQSRKLWLDSSATNDPMNDTNHALNTIWLILCGALVMIMQAGFAMVEAGACRAKNAQHIMMKNLTDVCVGTVGWFFFGYTFAYRGDEDGDGYMDNTFIGYLGFAGTGFAEPDTDAALADGKYVPSDSIASPNPYCHWFFQWAFCSAAATIVSGGVAERVNFAGYVFYSFCMTSFIYPVLVAWTWGYGWIAGSVNNVGYMDFAGSGVVHMAGGVGALAGAIFAGPRKGRWENPDAFAPHSLPLIVLGTFLLWFGWYGFNCGSTLGMTDEATAAKASLVAMNTTTAAATGGIGVVFLKYMEIKKYDIGAMCNGCLAGLVSITAPCANVDVGSAIIIGLHGAVFYAAASMALKRLKIDDPLDAFAVHGACGAWGVLAAAFFDWGTGTEYAHGWSGFTCIIGDDGTCDDAAWMKTFAANLVEVFMVIDWVGGLSCIVFAILRTFGMLTAGDEEQDLGADAAKHSPSKAYSIAHDVVAPAAPAAPAATKEGE